MKDRKKILLALVVATSVLFIAFFIFVAYKFNVYDPVFIWGVVLAVMIFDIYRFITELFFNKRHF